MINTTIMGTRKEWRRKAKRRVQEERKKGEGKEEEEGGWDRSGERHGERSKQNLQITKNIDFAKTKPV